jgi:hypothetical protein
MKKDKYKVIQCFLVWNEESDCQSSEPLWSERSAQEFIDDLNKREVIDLSRQGRRDS